MLTYTVRLPFSSSLGAPEVPLVVAYLRSRPSAGPSSDEAMFMQRKLLTEMTSKDEIAVVAEYVEVENESNDRPVYRAAYREAASRNCSLLTAGWGAIGTGSWFSPPNVHDADEPGIMKISVSYVRFAKLVPVPQGAPAMVTLWADYRRPQGVTAVYLCNAGPAPMEAVELTSVLCELGFDEGVGGGGRTLEPIPAGMARLVNTLFHDEWTYYSVYHLSHAASGLPQKSLTATDRPLNSEWLRDDPSKVWVVFVPATPSATAAEIVAP